MQAEAIDASADATLLLTDGVDGGEGQQLPPDSAERVALIIAHMTTRISRGQQCEKGAKLFRAPSHCRSGGETHDVLRPRVSS